MDISKFNSAISSSGYNPFSISGNDDNNAQKLAQENDITVEEAQKILKEAQEKVEQNEQLQQEYSAMLDVLNSQDEEELIEIDDADFDNFLKEESPEQKMQEIFNQQQFSKQNNTKDENKNNMFSAENNPFLKFNLQN